MGYAASLELRKIYQVVPDKVAAGLHQIRVIDESGEDYCTRRIILCGAIVGPKIAPSSDLGIE